MVHARTLGTIALAALVALPAAAAAGSIEVRVGTGRIDSPMPGVAGGEDLLPTLGGRIGLARSDQLALELAGGFHRIPGTGGKFQTSVVGVRYGDSSTTWEVEGRAFDLGLALAWAPLGNRYASLAASAGGARVDLSWERTTRSNNPFGTPQAETLTHSEVKPRLAAELRLDLPVYGRLSVGVRAESAWILNRSTEILEGTGPTGAYDERWLEPGWFWTRVVWLAIRYGP